MPITLLLSALAMALFAAAIGAVAGASPFVVLATYLLSGYAATHCLAARQAQRIRCAVAARH